MPGVHRNGDGRFCGATTIGTASSVLINGQPCAVEGDVVSVESHGGGGALKAESGAKNVYAEGRLIICAVGSDTVSSSDNQAHGVGEANPLGHSMNVILYGGAAGGGS